MVEVWWWSQIRGDDYVRDDSEIMGMFQIILDDGLSKMIVDDGSDNKVCFR